MTKKRGNGEGTIRKRPDGLWEARLSVPGRRAPKSFYGKTQAEAIRKREEARAQLNSGIDLNADRLTLGEYARAWLEKAMVDGMDVVLNEMDEVDAPVEVEARITTSWGARV